MDLEQIYYKPGDVVRDRKTDVDYVIESVAGMALVGGLYVTGLRLLTDRVDSWETTVNTMTDGHLLIMKNANTVSAADVRRVMIDKIDNMIKSNKDLLNELTHPSNKGLLDLLLYGVASDIDPDHRLTQGFLNLAESIVTITGQAPDKRFINEILMEGKPSNLTPEALEYMAETIHNYCKAKAKSSGFFNVKSVIGEAFLKQDGTYGGDAFTIMKAFRNRISGDRNSMFWKDKSLYDIIMGKGLLSDFDDVIFGGRVTENRIPRLLERMFQKNSGRSALNEQLKTLLFDKSLTKAIERGLKGNLSPNDPNAQGANLMIDALAHMVINEIPETSKHVVRRARSNRSTNSFQTPSRSEMMREMKRRYELEGRVESFAADSWRDSYNRRSAGSIKPKSNLELFRLIDRDRLLEVAKTPDTSAFAISKDAFFASFVGNSKVKLGNVEGTLKDYSIRNALREVNDTDPFLMITTQEMKDFEKHVSAGPLGDTYDLSNILNEQVARKSTLDIATRRQLTEQILDIKSGTGMNAIQPLETTESSLLFKITAPEKRLSGHQSDTAYTTSIKHAQALLRANPNADLVVAQVDPNSELYKRATDKILDASTPEIRSLDPFTTSKGDISWWRNALGKEDLNQKELLKLLKLKRTKDKTQILRNKEVDHLAIAASESKAYSSGQLALVNLRAPDGVGKLSFLASEQDTPLQKSIERGLDYLNGKGLILDIESDPSEKGWVTKQVAFGNDFKPTNYKKALFRTREGQADSLVKIANDLQRHIDSGITSIGTAGTHDFTTMISHLGELIEEAKVKPIKGVPLEKLERAREILTAIQKNNLFDVQVLHQIAGFSSGNMNQEVLTRNLLGRKQLHTADQDVIDLIEILTLNAKKIREGAKDIKLLDKEIFWMNIDSMSPVGPGRIKKFLGATQVPNLETGQEEFHVRYSLHDLKETNNGYEMVAANVIGTDKYDSPLAAASVLSNKSILFNSNQLNTQMKFNDYGVTNTESIGQRYMRLSKDYATRRTRSYNPFAQTRFDPTFQWTNEEGMYSAYSLKTDVELLDLFPKLLAKRQAEADRLLKGSATELREGPLINLMAADQRFIDEIVKESRLPVSEHDHTILKKRLFDALSDPTIKADLTPGSELHRLKASPVGRTLIDAANRAFLHTVNGEETAGDPREYFYKYAFLQGAAADQMKEQLAQAKAEGRAYELFKETAPRISLHLDSEKISLQLQKAEDVSAAKLEQSIEQLASHSMLLAPNDGNAVGRALKQLNISAEDYEKALGHFQSVKGLEAREVDINKWKEAISAISEKDKKFKTLYDVQQTIKRMNQKAILVGSFNEKITELTHILEKTDNEGLLSQILIAEDIRDSIQNTDSQLFEKTEGLLQKTLQHKEGIDVFRDRLLEVDMSKLTEEQTNAALEEMDSIVNHVLHRLENSRESVGELELLMHVAHKSRNAARQVGDPSYDSAAREAIKEVTDLHESGMEFSKIFQPTGANTVKGQHSAINQVRAAVQPITAGIKEQHQIVSEGGALSSISKAYSKVSTPLLALGGLIGLLSFKEPNTGEPFHQGHASDAGGFSGGESAIAKFSEIPGNPDSQAIWYGGQAPFQLDVTFSGFISDKANHERLQRDVYNIVNNTMEVRKQSGEIQDRRNRSHKMAAREAMNNI